jgi:hypothetical protein
VGGAGTFIEFDRGGAGVTGDSHQNHHILAFQELAGANLHPVLLTVDAFRVTRLAQGKPLRGFLQAQIAKQLFQRGNVVLLLVREFARSRSGLLLRKYLPPPLKKGD